MKLNITLDVSKINKEKIVPRTYLNKDGVEITEKNLKLEAVPLKEKKFVAEGDTWIMYKTHFIAEAQTKDERLQKAQSNFVGSGFQFEDKGVANTDEENAKIRALREAEKQAQEQKGKVADAFDDWEN